MSAMKERLIELAQTSGYDPLTPEGWAFVFGHEHGEHLAEPVAADIPQRSSPDWCRLWLDADAHDGELALEGCPAPLEGTYGPERLHADLEEVLGKPPVASGPASIGVAYELGFEQGWRARLRRAVRRRIGADRPLIVGDAEGRLTTELRRVAAEAGVEVTVSGEPANLADKLNPTRWRHAPTVLVTAPYAEVVAREVNARTYVRRKGVLLVTLEAAPQTWRDAVQMGAEQVAEWPAAELWLLRTLGDTGGDTDGSGR